MRLFFILLISSLFSMSVWSQKPKVFVFLPSEIRPYAMERELNKECPKLDISVFPRYREFRDISIKSQPEAILTLQPVASRTADLIIRESPQADKYMESLRGVKDGKDHEMYVLLAEQTIDSSKLEEITVGVINLLGRSEMSNYMGPLFGISSVRVKPVTKLEDLLSLLQFQYVSAIFVPESKVPYYLQNSAMKLQKTNVEGAQIGLPVLSIRETAPPKTQKLIINSFLKLEKETNLKLGVHQWSQQ